MVFLRTQIGLLLIVFLGSVLSAGEKAPASESCFSENISSESDLNELKEKIRKKLYAAFSANSNAEIFISATIAHDGVTDVIVDNPTTTKETSSGMTVTSTPTTVEDFDWCAPCYWIPTSASFSTRDKGFALCQSFDLSLAEIPGYKYNEVVHSLRDKNIQGAVGVLFKNTGFSSLFLCIQSNDESQWTIALTCQGVLCTTSSETGFTEEF